MTINLQKVYFDYRADEKNGRALLRQRDWYCRIAEFDPKSGEALPQALSSVLKKIATNTLSNNDGVIKDRLWRIVEHCRSSVERLFHSINESPRREHALLPVRAVRELDANSFIKLSNRPGRTIREKLAGKPYMQAVRRFQSVDLPENRLLKAFVRHLGELLELRRDCLGHEDELLSKILSWLNSEEVQAIGNWDNLPPNNTLLSHRDYRRVWDAWRLLQSLDDDVASDLEQLEARSKTMQLWKQSAQMWAEGKHLFAEMPLLFDYENFEISPWSLKQPLFNTSRKTIRRPVQRHEISEPVCVDFTYLHPRYFSDDSKVTQSLPDSFLWQQWRREGESIDIELYHSDAVWFHPQSTTISAPDLLFAKYSTSENCDRAARAFASHLQGVFRHDTLIWLAPDYLNDFELEVIRRNLNSRFTNSEPLPRSVAAVFEQIDYSKIRDGFAVVVVDNAGGKTCATKLLAKFDIELKKCLPETCGLYWERCPSVIIDSTDHEESSVSGCAISTVDANEQWHAPAPQARPKFVDASSLKSDPRIGNFAFCINLKESPVAGGICLHALQQRVGDIPLWRNQIPELSIKVMMDGIRQRFHLVSRGTTVKPIRGKAVSITIDEDFTLPSGKTFYQFPLYIGDNADDLGFSARLNSPAFPLKSDVVCDLKLTFEYGADEPYKLAFAPRDKSFPPVRTTWRRTEEAIIADAPAPEYPQPLAWADLRFVRKSGSNETSDLLEWVQNAIAQLDRDLYVRPKPRTTGVISEKWLTDKKGAHFTFATCNATEESVFIHQNSFSPGVNYTYFSEGQSISFELQERDEKYYGRKVAGPRYKDEVQLKNLDEESERSLIAKIHKSLYFPVIQVWRDGRSIIDPECPIDFTNSIRVSVAYFVELLMESAIPDSIKNEIRFILACLHKDMPDDSVQWLFEQIDNCEIREKQTVGFALGDVSEQWQKDLLSQLVEYPTSDALRVFSYAIWREQNFVEKFSLADLQAILNSLSIMLSNITPHPAPKHEKDKWTIHSWIRAITELLELLLGLLRTRTSTDPEIKIILQPHQKITKELARQVERVTDIVLRSDISLFSRVQINIQKPKGERTPDLLYALRLYLTGDDGANAIHISSVSDKEEIRDLIDRKIEARIKAKLL